MDWINQNIFAIISAATSFIASWAVFKTKVETLEKQIDAINNLKLEAELAVIKTELTHIRTLLEKKG